MRLISLIGLALLIAVGSPMSLGTDVRACSSMGPDVHAGVVKSVGDSSFVLADAETGKSLTFDATSVQLHGLTPGQALKVKFAAEDGRLKAVRVGR